MAKTTTNKVTCDRSLFRFPSLALLSVLRSGRGGKGGRGGGVVEIRDPIRGTKPTKLLVLFESIKLIVNLLSV